MKTKTKEMSWTEAWVKIERMIIIAAPEKKDCFLDCENAIKNSVMISYLWQENEKFAREMLHLFTCKAKNSRFSLSRHRKKKSKPFHEWSQEIDML